VRDLYALVTVTSVNHRKFYILFYQRLSTLSDLTEIQTRSSAFRRLLEIYVNLSSAVLGFVRANVDNLTLGLAAMLTVAQSPRIIRSFRGRNTPSAFFLLL
jgi:hypothetical protein